jgi:hypothetical protein
MKCSEFQEIARDYLRQESLSEESRIEADRHLSECGDCRRYLESQRTLTAQMKALAADLEKHEASPAVEEALVKAFAARGRRSAWPKWAARAIAAGLLAAGTYMGFQARQQATAQREPIAEFLPLRTGAVLNPGEAGDVVRIRVPRAELVRFGYPYNPEVAGQMVQADVLLGEDGVARAIRFVQ